MKEIIVVVVIPSYKVSKHILNVINEIPSFINYIIVVDDKCPENSGRIAESSTDNRVIVCYHDFNYGVGASVITGYKKSLELGARIVVKIDGDGQMDVTNIAKLIKPLIEHKADYTKGNRFKDFKALKCMPMIRLFGNSILSFLVKVTSGYWNIMDPTNGFTAITSDAINCLSLSNISKRYFFEIDILIHLNIENCVVRDIAIPAKYADEKSSMDIKKIISSFPPKLIKRFVKRIFYKYYINDFNMASIYLLLGIPMFLFGITFGFYRWYIAFIQNIENSTGTIMFAALPIILGTQFLLQAISIDIESIPKEVKS